MTTPNPETTTAKAAAAAVTAPTKGPMMNEAPDRARREASLAAATAAGTARLRREAFLATTTLAATARLSIDDLEAVTANAGPVSADMSTWIGLAPSLYKPGQVRICSVCLGGAILINPRWFSEDDQESLTAAKLNLKTTAREAGFPDALHDRLLAIDLLRKLEIADAKRALAGRQPYGEARTGSRRPESPPPNPETVRRAVTVENELRELDGAAAADPARAAREGRNWLQHEYPLDGRKLRESILFFRNVVIPALKGAGL